jgi:uncharacterized protein (TIGR00369 family)
MTVQELRKVLKQVPFNMLLGMRLRRVHRDGVTIDCVVRDQLRNSAGLVHGGIAAALADAAVGIGIQAHFKGGRRITTVEMKINYFLPVKEGRMVARSHLLRIGSSLCVGSVELRDDAGRLVGTAIVTYMFLDAKTGSGQQSEVRTRQRLNARATAARTARRSKSPR